MLIEGAGGGWISPHILDHQESLWKKISPPAPLGLRTYLSSWASYCYYVSYIFFILGKLCVKYYFRLTFGVIYLVVSKIEKSTRLSRKRKLLCKCLDKLKDENSTNKINCSQASTCTQGICDENQINSLCHSWNKELSGKTGKLTQSWNNWCKTKVENFTELSWW